MKMETFRPRILPDFKVESPNYAIYRPASGHLDGILAA
jgi:hypothetical protein